MEEHDFQARRVRVPEGSAWKNERLVWHPHKQMDYIRPSICISK